MRKYTVQVRKESDFVLYNVEAASVREAADKAVDVFERDGKIVDFSYHVRSVNETTPHPNADAGDEDDED